MSQAPRPPRHGWPVLALLAAFAVAGWDGSPTAAAQRDHALAVPDPVAARMATVPPAMERGIQELLQTWTASWASMDGNAYGANYAGSVQTAEVRRIVPPTGTLAIVDVDVVPTGYVALPPGLGETAPGEVATRTRLVVGKTGPRWEILAQQLTRIAPPPS